MLTPVALAHWLMQDGSPGTKKGVYFCTDAFAPEDVERLATHCRITFGLVCSTPKAPGKKELRIYIFVASVPRLRELVFPYMYPTMFYKLGL